MYKPNSGSFSSPQVSTILVICPHMMALPMICNANFGTGHLLCGPTAIQKGMQVTHFTGRFDTRNATRNCVFLASVTRLLLRSHSRPSEVPLSEQNRMLRRSREEFALPTGRQSEELFFLLSPTDKSMHPTPGRGSSTAKARANMKKSKSSTQLLERLHKAIQQDMVDASVIGAAMQRCGHGLWWKTLIEIRELQEDMGIALHCIENNLLLHALASCLKCKKSAASEMEMRKQKAFRLAKTIWGHPLPSVVEDFNCALSSALQVCVRVGSKESFAWADELWTWSEKQPFERTLVTFTARLFLWEMQGRHSAVDKFLLQCLSCKQELNAVVLGTLIEGAATRFDSKRADAIWETLVFQHKVQTNFLAYTAYAKTQVLAGKPQTAVNIIDEMIEAGDGPMDYKLAVDYLQALLVVSDSSLSSSDLSRLGQFLQEGEAIVAAKSAKSGKQDWMKLALASRKLMSNPQSLYLADVLISRLAKESLMNSWKNHRAGTCYLSSGNFKLT